jgi:hypothetical protein
MSRRIRSLKPELIEDEKVSPLSDSAFRLFVSMITLADDHGNVRADVRWLQCQIWWAHGEPPNVLSALLELHRASLIEPYGVRGGTYVHLRGWEKHQRIDNAGKNKVPPRNDADALDIDVSSDADWRLSPKVSANLGESGGRTPGSPLDMDRKGRERDMDAAANSPPAKPKKSALLSLFPADWSPRSEERAKAVSTGLNCDAEVEAFRDHHTARGNRMSDWDSAFRTWLRNAVKFSNGRQGSLVTDAPIRKVKTL